MKKRDNTQRGITLIALIITIIVLLILVGISITLLTGENGNIKKAILAKKQTEIAEEKERVQLAVMSSYMENSDATYGEPLYDQNNFNANTWNVIVSTENKDDEYGTGWNYIPKGTELEDYGKTNFDWVINYETGELIYLEAGKYTKYSHEMNLAITDYIFNLDSSNVGSEISSWGDNISLRYYDSSEYKDETSRKNKYDQDIQDNTSNGDVTQFTGYDRAKADTTSKYIDNSTKAFKFDGSNYIEVYNEQGFDFSQGFTFEYYGKIHDSVPATQSSNFIGLLGLWNGLYNEQCITRMGYNKQHNGIHYALISEKGEISNFGTWSTQNTPWNQIYELSDIIDTDKYITITFNPKQKDNIVQSIYIDGNLVAEGELSREYYNAFLLKTKDLKYIEIGRCTMGAESNWCYLDGLCYTTRIYNRALSSQEVFENYDTTVTYRNLINQ